MSCGSPRRGRGPSKSNWNKNFAIRPPGRCLSGWSGSSLSRNAAGQFRHSCSTGRRSAWRTAHRVRPSFPGRAARATGRPGAPFWFVARRRQIVLSDGFSRGTNRSPSTIHAWTRQPWPGPPGNCGRVRGEPAMPGWSCFFPIRSIVPAGRAARPRPPRTVARPHTLRVAALSGSASEGDLDPSVVPWNEGAAILRGNWHAPQARAFLRFLADHHGATPGRETPDLDPEVSDLLADLLGATLVDAQEELLIAGSNVARAGGPASAQAQAWLTESPPWPPASVEKLQTRGGDIALAMVQDLAGQIAPDPEPRFWLVQSWLRPARPIDHSMLTELARAAGGRLVREPRFRAWLRGEWTAWARQRYRRVARLAAGTGFATGATPPRSPLPRDRS